MLKNYTLTQPTGVTANITNGWNPVKDTEYTASIPNAKGWLKEDLTVAAKDGYELSLTNTADGTWKNTLIGAVESADSSLKFYVRNKTTGAISEQVTVAYKLDKNTETTRTTGKVEFVGRSSWQTFVNHITFGLFYKDEVTVKAEADDGLSGVASIEYAVSDKAMSLEEVMAITDWTAMPKNGVEFDADSKNGKVIAAMMDLLEEMAATVTEHDDALDQVYDELETLDQDLDDVVSDIYGDDEEDDDEDEEEEDHGALYEVTCPNCGEISTLDEETLMDPEGDLVCPHCGATFDIELEGTEEDSAEETDKQDR